MTRTKLSAEQLERGRLVRLNASESEVLNAFIHLNHNDNARNIATARRRKDEDWFRAPTGEPLDVKISFY